jgi:hypothetical protein
VGVIVELPFELGLVKTFGVSDVCETEVILFGPEERHGVEPLPSPKHVASSSVSLALAQWRWLASVLAITFHCNRDSRGTWLSNARGYECAHSTERAEILAFGREHIGEIRVNVLRDGTK